MPIGVPRIIYCWGEELPAQWTDIYNFIFRRRMVFLMQYLDDELCNQICGLLINIHMEDRSKELEKKEMENSGLFKSSTSQKKTSSSFDTQMSLGTNQFSGSSKKKERSIEDLMISEDDLAIDENNRLETHTLQKISLEWLNWNSQFFDYSEEPYLFYLAELLAKDMTGNNSGLLSTPMNNNKSISDKELAKLMMMFKQINTSKQNNLSAPNIGSQKTNSFSQSFNNQNFDIYSPFRLLANKISNESMNSKDFQVSSNLRKKLQQIAPFLNNKVSNNQIHSSNNQFDSMVSDIANKEFLTDLENSSKNKMMSEKAFTQRQLRRDYTQENMVSSNRRNKNGTSFNYLNPDQISKEKAYLEYRDSYRKQTEKALQEEESKKVFMVINSFGGSVGNGITIHDALQFIKAGSMTLGLGVAASAASLVLAGGTIGERYVTEGCHVMMHQPEGGLTGQASDIWIDSQEILKIRLDVAEIYSLSTYRPRHKILRDLDRDFYLTAMETIYYGLADEIATNEVMHSIIEMTSKVWDYHDTQQQKLLESRDSATSGLDTQTQN
uniref:ATP-dependent Clp protease proteolytic subunit n=1 Tax=Hariotina reticulata TaxID=183314 RepID=A0A2R4PAR4_9CHLO|nr:ATP-dependent Clp protease proteolytic subunit [Hariotina reticulata]